MAIGLVMLVFGHISASEVARMGRLDVNEDSALPMWDKVMRTKYCPFCDDISLLVYKKNTNRLNKIRKLRRNSHVSYTFTM